MPHQIDPEFAALPLTAIADAALQRAQELGVEHADVRLERIRTADLALHDARLETSHDDDERGLAVRVVHDGTWGFAGGLILTPAEAVRLVDRAVEVAAVSKPVTGERIELAPEPGHGEQTWISSYDVDPFSVSEHDRIELLADWSNRVLGAEIIRHVDATLKQVRETKFYADLSGTRTTQQRVRMQCQITGLWVDDATGRFETMRTIAPPVGRGWEFLTDERYDWSTELATLPEYLLEKSKAPSVEPGTYDLVVDPSNMWLTIHESIGHATELDRALGYEANYAGTSFATPDQLGSLHYGSPLMHVTGDRQVEHGLASIGFDDEGVQAQTWDLIKDGLLVGYQLDRRTAALRGIERSNGCAFADSPLHVPIQRMANVSLQPVEDGPSTEDLIGGVEDGLYVVGDKSWSIDMQRYNFQFTGQRFFRIRNGVLVGQVRDAAYQATTTDFWRSMSVVGGPQTYVLGGAFNCGKGQPGQVAAVSHGCPVALFNGVRILNATQEAAQ
ncbi:MAG: TldD/PmbA family protein [Frankiaceae bacterium]|nr:TldD/PmbA family protein [Frankiaceae bacterium]MBV9869004.1 TldD/PmbA family protein [Frankiaceae bacterium]